MNIPTFRDVEQISALLDGKLSQAEAAKLESRIRSDRNLQKIMQDLSETRGLLRQLPKRRAPRNFTLTPRMAGVKPPIPRAVPGLRFATVLATFLLVFSLATNALTPALRQAAQAPAWGMGGGGGGGYEGPEVMSAPATEAPALELAPPEAEPLPSLVPTLTMEDDSRIVVTPTPDASLKGIAPGPDAQDAQPATESVPQAMPIPSAWILTLLAIALISPALAWLLRWRSERSWRAKMK